MKKWLLCMMAIGCLMVSGCSCSKKEKPEEEETPTVTPVEGEEITKEQVINGIRFTNVSLVVNDGISEFRVTLENTVTTVKKITGLKILLKGEYGNTLAQGVTYDFENLKKGDSKNISMKFTKDLKDVISVEYQLEMGD